MLTDCAKMVATLLTFGQTAENSTRRGLLGYAIRPHRKALTGRKTALRRARVAVKYTISL